MNKTAPQTMYQQGNLKSILEKAVSLNLPVLLVGETGVGKTAFIRELARENKKDLVRLNLTGQTGIDEFIGKFLANDKGTYWIDGSLTNAMKKGQWIVLDEINMALPEILAKLHSLLDDDRKIVINEKDGEEVYPHDDFRIFATMNPSDEYAGTKELNRAFLSRFPIVLDVDYSDKEKQILMDRTSIDEATADTLVAIGREIRDRKYNGQVSSICSTRDLLYCSQLYMAGVDLSYAIQASILNKFPRDEANALDKMIGVITGNKIKVKTDKGEEYKSVSALVSYVESVGKEMKLKDVKIDELTKQVMNNAKETDKYKKKVELFQTRYERIKTEMADAIPVELED